ncbi:MAG: DUF805 domain-containing protein [Oscillospiraceae bacterium]|nr:DUF805 domain-containing protein [Oscillospiraceae bacterium]
MRAYLDAWKRYADFSGRTNRRDYWVAVFTHAGFNFLYQLAVSVGGIIVAYNLGMDNEVIQTPLRYMLSLYSALFILPGIAMTVRRVRDAGFRTKLLILLIIPPAGLFAILARLFMRSAEEEADPQTL